MNQVKYGDVIIITSSGQTPLRACVSLLLGGCAVCISDLVLHQKHWLFYLCDQSTVFVATDSSCSGGDAAADILIYAITKITYNLTSIQACHPDQLHRLHDETLMMT